MGLSFTGLEHILKFLPRGEKNSLLQSIIHINWVGNQEVIFWVPDVLCLHSEVVLWNLLSV